MGLSNKLSCEAGIFSYHLNPHRSFQSEILSLYFPILEPLVCCSVCLAPQLFLPVYLHVNVGPPRSTSCCLTQYTSHLLTHPGPPAATLLSPLHPSFPSPPLLLVWMNVSSLTPWLSDFHTVQLSSSSGYVLFLNLFLSFFWLCEEARCIYLRLHVGQKSISGIFYPSVI